MKIKVNDLGKYGIIADLDSEEIPAEGLSACINVRCRRNRVEKSYGHVERFGAPSGAPRWLLPWSTAAQYYWIYVSSTNIYRTDGSSHVSIGSGYTTSSDTRWSGAVFNGVPIVNNDNGVDAPQAWNGAAMVDLPNWPATTQCDIIRPWKNVLVALAPTEGGTYLPHTIRTSSIADPGTVPSSWDYTSAATLATRRPLANSGGFLIDCLQLGDDNIVYKEDAVFRMRWRGGQAVYESPMIFSEFGMLAPDCAREIRKKHIVVAQGDVIAHNGLAFESVIDGRNRDYLFSDMDSSYTRATYTVHYGRVNEFWVCYVAVGSTTGIPNKALVWNYKDNTWSVRDIPEMAYISPGLVDTSAVSQAWDDDTQVWDDDLEPWGQRDYAPQRLQLLAADPTNTKLYELEIGETLNGGEMTSYAERYGAPVADQRVEPSVRKVFKRVWWRISCNGSVRIRLGVQQHYNGPVEWTPEVTYTPGDDNFTDLNIEGIYFCWRVETSSNARFALYGFTVEVEPTGEETSG